MDIVRENKHVSLAWNDYGITRRMAIAIGRSISYRWVILDERGLEGSKVELSKINLIWCFILEGKCIYYILYMHLSSHNVGPTLWERRYIYYMYKIIGNRI